MQNGGTALQAEAGERTFAQPDARAVREAVRVRGGAGDELAEERSDVGVVADDKYVLVGRTFFEQALKLGVGGFGKQAVGDEDALLVAGLCGDELGGLEAALQRAGDDEVEANFEGVEDVSEVEAVALAFFVERAPDIEQWIGAFDTGAGVAEKKKVHAGSSVLEVSGMW